MTLTVEWLEQTIAAMEYDRDDMPFGFDEESELTLEALLLARLYVDAHPVAYLVAGGNLYQDRPYITKSAAMAAAEQRQDGSRVVPLCLLHNGE
ncbi:hypothetical protein GWD52_20935 [Enterobacteriaceae bacterium 4M9]|nr:hypothetical protein [Enterobacteriaceae bacterium 4M9]